jgi:hypothetical protein
VPFVLSRVFFIGNEYNVFLAVYVSRLAGIEAGESPGT